MSLGYRHVAPVEREDAVHSSLVAPIGRLGNLPPRLQDLGHVAPLGLTDLV
ncbi:hypothetical protein J4G02_03305 [Candidatus Poribacteria bacterium]|nr:hypothetical protein [Candidatus Poribacteria bacterium]